MNAGIISLPSISNQSSLVGGHDPFRAHAFSSLVAISVLLGSMFTAHSAIAELASINTARLAFDFVLDVRAEISAIPDRAGDRMAAISAARMVDVNVNQQSQSEIAYFSFESGLESLFAAPISLGRSEVSAIGIESVLASEYNALYVQFEPVAVRKVANNVGGLGLGVGESVRDNILPLVTEFSSAIDDMAMAAVYVKEFSINTYVHSIYKWVEHSPRVASSLVGYTHSIGSTVISGTILAMTVVPDTYISTVGSWTNITTEVAKSVVTQQITVGETAIIALVDLRHISSGAQQVIAERAVVAISDAYENTFGLVEGVPQTATAAVADFLILEEK